MSEYKIGDEVKGTIQSLNGQHLIVHIGKQAFIIPDSCTPSGEINDEVYRIGDEVMFYIISMGKNVINGMIVDPSITIKKTDLYVGQVLTGKVMKYLQFGIILQIIGVYPNSSILIPQNQCAPGIARDSAQSILEKILPLYTKCTFVVTHIYDGDKLKGSLLPHIFKKLGANTEEIKFQKPESKKPKLNFVKQETTQFSPQDEEKKEVILIMAESDQEALSMLDFDFKPQFINKQVDFKLHIQEIAIKQPENIQKIKLPTNERDFEVLIAQQPKSSFIYLSYAAFQLELANLDAALKILERALQNITQNDPEDIQERLNIISGRLQIHLKFFGKDNLLNEIKTEFAKSANPGQLCCQIVNEIEPDIANQVFEIFFNSKTRRQDFEAQKARLEFLYKNQRSAEARQLIQQIIVQTKMAEGQSVRQFLAFVARLEYQNKFLDEGRAAFEKLIETSKIDIILQYLEAEVKFGEVEYLRLLYKRILEKDYGARQNKVLGILLKKYLEFENLHGTKQQIKDVQTLALQLIK
ncbi:S1 RNA binding domain-containing protein [Spironucleus salmonicida]|uniref:S1 RNA binding domain-containing protein n=1 Tax=Spironucleus salmonicida TaxID=348837 RepID=V6LYB8_9EUKA|nr:S1 RNA binding domain-containing protein [Spironucleus salmonicida]|eukprot:EST49228.1 S1 RNA binding domain-containing protein [Spironucleus salmonicida]